jgi:putative ABC transport system permease protein
LFGALAPPSSYTTLWVGLQNRGQVFSARRAIESLPGAPLTAALPGVTLDELWRTLSVVERGFALVGWVVSIGALLSVAAVTLVSLASRRREFAILRAVGAGPAQVAWLILLEATLVGLAGVLLGLLVQQVVVWWFADFLRIEYGVAMSVLNLPPQAWLSLMGLGMASVAISLLPAWRARRLSLADGLHPPVA